MVIQHNLSALNANRQLGIVKNNLSKLTEKLSSGYKINRAADDAAGLSISEKMRKQIRGLTQAAENIQDGISLCQVADGALNETTDILQRMNELAIQAANGTNSTNDREDIQLEIDQLSSEIDRIAHTTSFNEWIYPLKSYDTNPVANNNLSVWELPDEIYIKQHDIRIAPNSNVTIDGINYTNSQNYTFQTVSITWLGYKKEVSGTTYYAYYLDCYDPNYDADYYNNYKYTYQTSETQGVSTGIGTYFTTSLSDIKVEESTGYVYVISKNSGDKVYFWDSPNTFGTTTDLSKVPANAEIIKGRNNQPLSNYSHYSTTNCVYIQSTDEAHEGLHINLVDATMRGLFSSSPNISVLNESSCSETIDKISEALKKVNEYRSYFGAVQNRLEHAYNINQNTVENTQYAESQLRDTDMAEEMVKYSKTNILAQAGQSMLAQANQSNQGVLSLIA